jgi:hypothetical protein
MKPEVYTRRYGYFSLQQAAWCNTVASMPLLGFGLAGVTLGERSKTRGPPSPWAALLVVFGVLTLVCAGMRWIALWRRQGFRQSTFLGYEKVPMLDSLHAYRNVWEGDIHREGNSRFYQGLGLYKTIPL